MASAAAFADSVVQNSKIKNCVTSNLNYNYNITMQGTNPEVVEITTKHDHDPDSGLGSTRIETQVHPVAHRRVTFANEGNSNLNSEVDVPGPKCISRLNMFRGSTTKRSTGSVSVFQSQRTTSTNVRGSYFTTVDETPETLLHKLHIKQKTVRDHMQAAFFLEPSVIPLWNPAPASVTFHPNFIETNLCVGDVGFFNECGGFEVQFNIFLSSAKNGELGFDPPEGFQAYGNVQFSYEISDTTFVSPDKYRSRSGKFQPFGALEGRCVASYHLSRGLPRAGNILHLPNGFWRDRMRTPMLNAVNNHVGRQAHSWYDYYHNKPEGPSIPKGHCLKIIIMSYKCDAWALAACSTSSSAEIFARLCKSPHDRNSYRWEKHHKVLCDTGTAPFPNQCVAVEVRGIESSRPIQILLSKLSYLSRGSLSIR